MFKTSFSTNFGPLPVPVASYPLSYDIYYPGNVKASSETHEARAAPCRSAARAAPQHSITHSEN